MDITNGQDVRATVIIEYYRSGSVSLPRFFLTVIIEYYRSGSVSLPRFFLTVNFPDLILYSSLVTASRF